MILLIFYVLFSSTWAPRIYSLFPWSSTPLSPSFPSSFALTFIELLGLPWFDYEKVQIEQLPTLEYFLSSRLIIQHFSLIESKM
jgi:hypothetical protein